MNTVRAYNRSSRITLNVALLLALAIGGCARSPEIEYFAVSPDWSGTAAGSPGGTRILVEVTTPTIPTYIDRAEVVERIDERKLKIHEDKRWVADFDKVIRDYFIASLHDKSATASFVTSATKIADQATFRLDTFFNRFDIYHQDRIEIVLTWQIMDSRGNLLSGLNDIRFLHRLDGDTVDSIVIALEVIFEQIADEIAIHLQTSISRFEETIKAELR